MSSCEETLDKFMYDENIEEIEHKILYNNAMIKKLNSDSRSLSRYDVDKFKKISKQKNECGSLIRKKNFGLYIVVYS